MKKKKKTLKGILTNNSQVTDFERIGISPKMIIFFRFLNWYNLFLPIVSSTVCNILIFILFYIVELNLYLASSFHLKTTLMIKYHAWISCTFIAVIAPNLWNSMGHWEENWFWKQCWSSTTIKGKFLRFNLISLATPTFVISNSCFYREVRV